MKKIYLIPFLAAGLVLMGPGCISFGGTSSGGTDGGVFKSTDKAENWQQKVAVAATKPSAISNVNVVNIVFDPGDSRTIYLGTAENGLFYTTDGGDSWFTGGALSSGKINAIAVDAKNKCNVYASIGNKIFKTSDCLRSWQNVYIDTRADQAVTSLAVDSYNPSLVYAGLSGGDFVKSSDQGGSWTTLKRFENKVSKILVNYYDTRILYVATADRGIWKSTDSGANWTDLSEKINEYNGAKVFKNLLMDFSQRDYLLLVSKYGLLKSTDGGTNWQPISLITPPGSADIISSDINPQNGNEIYYGTATTLYKSVDGGARWVTRKLPTTRAATSLAVDPANGSVVYLGVTKFKK
jgi:photosystem II stability/assembly factor-like uncharacterized protein